MPNQPDDPNVFRNAKPGEPVVWGTYKEAFELFGQGDHRPTPWDSFRSSVTPCAEAAEGAKVMVMANKGGTLIDGANEAFSFPLIDQNRHYACTEVRFNKAQYNFVRGLDDNPKSWLYLAKNLARAQPIAMPASRAPKTVGSIMLKATWRKMTVGDDQNRYYVVDAWIVDADSSQPKCVQAKMGLVGLHIVQKLDDFAQWIWSSFEQVDNVARGLGATASTPISFKNGTDNPKTVDGWANRPIAKVPPLLPYDERIPVQVTRYNPIPATPEGRSTQDLNKVYQKLLAGTVWAHYQLVITQWPSTPVPQDQFITIEQGGVYPADAGGAFPQTGCTNTALET